MAESHIPGLGGVEKFLNRKEVDALRASLESGEKVRAAAGGVMGRRTGLLAATSHRIIFITTGSGKPSVKSWGYGRVERVHAEVDLDDAALTLHADHQVFVVNKVPRLAAQAFADAVRDAAPKSQFRRVELVEDPTKASADRGMFTLVDERLRALKRQFDKGSITEAEFRANRRRILENAGMPTDLKLGMSTRTPVKDPEPEPKKAPAPWPERKKKAEVEWDPEPWPDPKLPK
ncbi:MAG: PH domain-containing protein [bacterium]